MECFSGMGGIINVGKSRIRLSRNDLNSLYLRLTTILLSIFSDTSRIVYTMMDELINFSELTISIFKSLELSNWVILFERPIVLLTKSVGYSSSVCSWNVLLICCCCCCCFSCCCCFWEEGGGIDDGEELLWFFDCLLLLVLFLLLPLALVAPWVLMAPLVFISFLFSAFCSALLLLLLLLLCVCVCGCVWISYWF